jgi:hypothetical protein
MSCYSGVLEPFTSRLKFHVWKSLPLNIPSNLPQHNGPWFITETINFIQKKFIIMLTISFFQNFQSRLIFFETFHCQIQTDRYIIWMNKSEKYANWSFWKININSFIDFVIFRYLKNFEISHLFTLQFQFVDLSRRQRKLSNMRTKISLNNWFKTLWYATPNPIASSSRIYIHLTHRKCEINENTKKYRV